MPFTPKVRMRSFQLSEPRISTFQATRHTIWVLQPPIRSIKSILSLTYDTCDEIGAKRVAPICLSLQDACLACLCNTPNLDLRSHLNLIVRGHHVGICFEALYILSCQFSSYKSVCEEEKAF